MFAYVDTVARRILCRPERYTFGIPRRVEKQSRPYHGTGLPHLHILLWTDCRVTETNLCSCLRADFSTGVLKEAVQRQQRLTITNLQVNSENTVWEYVEDKWKFKVRHPQDAADACVQPHLEAVCRSHIGHQCFLSVGSAQRLMDGTPHLFASRGANIPLLRWSHH